MKHRIFHSKDLRAQLPEYAKKLGVSLEETQSAFDWMLANNIVFETPTNAFYVALMRMEKRIAHPLAQRFFIILSDEIPGKKLPDYGRNWPTFVDRCRRVWEQVYNILINKIPSHTVRIAWLRLGGAKIGKGSTLWRNTEVIGIESLEIGDDTCIGWHCQIDARAGLIIGNHVTIASHAIVIAGGHDLQAPEFWAVGAPIFIDDYAWITTRAILISGARIGEGAVVSANCVVRKEVEPYAIVAGSDGKTIGTRAKGLNYKVGGKGLFAFLH